MRLVKLSMVGVLSFLLIFPQSVFAEVVGTVTFIEGRVDCLSQGEERYIPLVAGDTISEGDTLRTKSYSKAEFTLDDDSIVRIAESTQMRVTDYAVDENGTRLSGEIDLDRGKLRAIVAKTPDLVPFNVNTPNAQGSVKGSDIFVSFQQSATSVMVSEGVFTMENPLYPGEDVDVAAGMTANVPYNAPPVDPRVFLPNEIEKLETVTGPTVRMIEGVSPDAECTNAIVSKVSGAVRVQPSGSKKWHATSKGEALNAGDRIETGETGRIQIHFDNGLVMDLKEKSQIIIIQLTRDPKTGNYESIFESEYGRIISKLQNKPKDSKFEVRTPQAACGVRGTIMYQVITPGLTKVFFEGGSGFLKNFITGAAKDIQEGMSETVFMNGTQESAFTTEYERSQFSSEWGNEDQDEYGYSEAEGDPGDTDPTGGDPIDPIVTDPVPTDPGTGLFDDIVPDAETDDSGSTEETEGLVGPVGIIGGSDMKCGEYGSFLEDRESSVQGDLMTTSNTAPWDSFGSGGSFSFLDEVERTDLYISVFLGECENPNDKDLFWGEISGVSSGDGRFSGFMAGADVPSPTEAEWLASQTSIFIDGSSTAGIMFTGVAGLYNVIGPGDTAGAGLTFYLPLEVTDIQSDDLEGALFSESLEAQSFNTNMNSGEGWIFGDVCYNTLSIREDNSWGVWEGIFDMSYNRPGDASEWTGYYLSRIGSRREADSETKDPYEGDGEAEQPLPGQREYSFVEVNGTDDQNGFLSLDFQRVSMDQFTLNTSFGSVFGTYEEIEGEEWRYQGVGTGGSITEDLSYANTLNGTTMDVISGIWYDPYSWIYSTRLYGNEESSFFGGVIPITEGEFIGRMGGVDSLWNGGSNVMLLGEFSDPGEEGLGNNIFFTPVYSLNGSNRSYTTYDGGAYYGYIVGSNRPDGSDGIARMLYVDPENNIGYISGNITGQTYANVTETGNGAFLMGGTLKTNEMETDTGINPEDLYDGAYTGELSVGDGQYKVQYTGIEVLGDGIDEELVEHDTLSGFGLNGNIGPGEIFDGEEFIFPEAGSNLFGGVMIGEALSFEGAGWGIWNAGYGGIFIGNDPASLWDGLSFVGVLFLVDEFYG